MAAPAFSQLKSLAKDIENGIEHFQREIVDSPGTFYKNLDLEKNHLAAVSEMRHKWKDARDLKSNVEKTKADFELRNESFTRVCNLFEEILNSLPPRLENIENYLESYGYQRPPSSKKSESNEKCTAEFTATESDGESQGDENENVEEGKTENKPKDEITGTKLIQKPQFPKLEDLYKNLSEETIMLFKHGLKTEKTPQKSHQNSEIIDNNTSVCVSSSSSVTTATAALEGLSTTPRPEATLGNDCVNSEFQLHATTHQQFYAKDNDDASCQATSVSCIQSTRTSLLALPQPPKLRTDTLSLLGAFNKNSSHCNAESSMSGGKIESAKSTSTSSISSAGDPFDDDTKTVHVMRNKENVGFTYPEAPVLHTQDFSNSSFLFKNCETAPTTKSAMDRETPLKPELLTQRIVVMNARNDNASAANSNHHSRDGGEQIGAPPKKDVRSLSALSPPKPPKLLSSYSFFKN